MKSIHINEDTIQLVFNSCFLSSSSDPVSLFVITYQRVYFYHLHFSLCLFLCKMMFRHHCHRSLSLPLNHQHQVTKHTAVCVCTLALAPDGTNSKSTNTKQHAACCQTTRRAEFSAAYENLLNRNTTIIMTKSNGLLARAKHMRFACECECVEYIQSEANVQFKSAKCIAMMLCCVALSALYVYVCVCVGMIMCV